MIADLSASFDFQSPLPGPSFFLRQPVDDKKKHNEKLEENIRENIG